MKKKLNSFVATFILLAIVISLSFSSLAIEIDSNYEQKQRLLSIAHTDYLVGVEDTEYPDFPLNIEISIPSQDISYSYYEVSEYLGTPEMADNVELFTYELPSVDFSEIDYEVNISLKSGFNHAILILCDEISGLSVHEIELSSTQAQSVDIELNTDYSFNLYIDEIEYCGTISWLSTIKNKLTYAINYCNISEKNNTIQTEMLNLDSVMYITSKDSINLINDTSNAIVSSFNHIAKISNGNSIYEYITNESGILGIAAVSNKDCDIKVYDSNNEMIASHSGSGNSYVETYVVENTPYYIEVSSDSDTEANVQLSLERSSAYRWYSQYRGIYSTGFTGVWELNNLDKVYFPNAPTTYANRPFMINDPDKSTYTTIMDQGCFVTCWAMLLSNTPTSSALSGYYDLRYSNNTSIWYTRGGDVDPYVVTMVNAGLRNVSPSTIYDSSTGRYNFTSYTRSYSPVYCYNSTIVSGFGRSYVSVPLNNGETESEKIAAVVNGLENGLSGVIVWVGGGHYIVITEDLGSNISDPNQRFVIYDPAATSDSQGAGVTWANSSSSYSFSDVAWVYYLNS